MTENTRPAWRKKRYIIPTAGIVAFFGLGLIGSQMDPLPEPEPTPVASEEETTPEPTPEETTPEPVEEETTPEPEKTTSEPADDDLLEVPVDRRESILLGFDNEGAGYEVLDAVAVVTEEYGDPLTYIALEVTGPGFDSQIGVWASPGESGNESGPIWSVDGFAQEFSVWPNGTANFQLSVTDDAAERVIEALRE